MVEGDAVTYAESAAELADKYPTRAAWRLESYLLSLFPKTLYQSCRNSPRPGARSSLLAR